MATVNAVVAHPKANSYVSLEEISDFMLAVDPNWVHTTPSEAARYAIMTAAKINAIRYLGQPYFARQGMAFPRKNDARVRSAPLTGLSAVTLGAAVEEYVPANSSSGCSFTTDNFPIAAATNTVEVTLSGQTVALTDSGAGVLTGTGVAGTINYETGDVTLDTQVDEGTVARVAASWYSSSKLVSADLVFDAAEYLPGHFNGGAVHVPHSDGQRDYCTISDHNIVSGVVTLDARMNAQVAGSCLLFQPFARPLKDAQLIQLQAERGLLDWDRNAGRGISAVKIGDTSRSYSTTNIPEKARMLAGKYRVHEIVMALLGPYTIYGKMGIIYGEWDAASTTSTE